MRDLQMINIFSSYFPFPLLFSNDVSAALINMRGARNSRYLGNPRLHRLHFIAEPRSSRPMLAWFMHRCQQHVNYYLYCQIILNLAGWLSSVLSGLHLAGLDIFCLQQLIDKFWQVDSLFWQFVFKKNTKTGDAPNYIFEVFYPSEE